MQHYSTLYAKDMQKKAYKKENKITILKAIISATFRFFKNFFFKKDFLYGYEGLVISVSNANGVFYKYMKLYEKAKK